MMVKKPEWFGIEDATLAPRITFLLVGIWWFGFAQIAYKKLPNNIYNHKPEKDYIWKGFRELKIVAKDLVNYPQLRTFLISFFFYSIGVQTIILMAGIFGSKEEILEWVKDYKKHVKSQNRCLETIRINITE